MMRVLLPLLALCLNLPAPVRAEGPAVIGLLGRGGILVPMPGARVTGAPAAPGGRRLPLVVGPPGVTRSVGVLASPGRACRDAIREAEREAGMPVQLMAAIARVESGRPDAEGIVHPWPWTINAEGNGSYYNSKAEAIAAVQALQARGVKSIDVGCMQVNLMYHPDAFASLDQAFDPVINARYAADFLGRLYAQTQDWSKATAYYHSATPGLGDAYQRKVAAVLPDEMRRLGDPAGGRANVWSVNAWSANAWNTGAPPAFRGRSGGFMLGNGASGAKIIRMPTGATGRGLSAYRAAPVTATR